MSFHFSTDPAEPSALPRSNAPLRVWLAWFLMGISLRAPVASIPPLIHQIQRELLISDQAAAMLTATPVLLMGALPILIPVVVGNRVPWTRVADLALLLVAAATALRWVEPAYLVLLASCAAVGAGVATCQLLVPAATARTWPTQAAALTAVYVSGMGLGSAGAAAVSPMFAQVTGSWGPALASWALAPLATMVALRVAGTADALPAPEGRPGRLRTPVRLLVQISVYCMGSASLFWTLMTWIAPMFQAAGRSEADAGLLMALFSFAQIPGSLAVGHLWNRWRFGVPMALLALMAATVPTLPMLGAGPLAWVSAAAAGIGCGGLFSLAMFLPAYFGRDEREVRSMTALTLTAGYLLASLGPILLAVLRSWSGSYTVAFTGFATICIPMWIAVRNLRRHQRS